MEYCREIGVIPNFTLSGIDLTDEMAEKCAYKLLIYETGIRLGHDPTYRKAKDVPVGFTYEKDASALEKEAHSLLHAEIDTLLLADYEEAVEYDEDPEDQYDGFIIAACIASGKDAPDKPEIRVIADAHETPLTKDTYEELKADREEELR